MEASTCDNQNVRIIEIGVIGMVVRRFYRKTEIKFDQITSSGFHQSNDNRRALCKACNINGFFDTFFLPQITQNTDRQPLATISSQLVNNENRQNGDQPVANEEVRKIVTFPHAIFANLDKINIEAEQNRLLQIQIEKPCIYEDESLKSPAPRKLYTPTKIERKRYRRQKSDPDFKCGRRNANDQECEEPTNTICLRSKRKL